jgi:hypothetical protein
MDAISVRRRAGRTTGTRHGRSGGPDLRILSRDKGGLLYRGFLLYRQDIQRV